MPIPDFQSIMRPLLKLLSDGQVWPRGKLVQPLATEFSLTDEELHQTLPKSQQGVFQGRVGWAVTYLYQAGLLERPARGEVKITQRGLHALAQKERIGIGFLSQFPEFVEFKSRKKIDVS